MNSAISLHSAKGTDRPALVEVLRAVSLPTADLAEELDHFIVARQSEKIVGSVGLEVYGSCALLRSLAVDPARQGTGLGKFFLKPR
jgi:amino-acid N-acetyltransferase